jgi:hypothetical protein
MDTSRQITKAYRRPRSRISFSWTTRHLKKLVNEFKEKYNTQSKHSTIIQLLDEFHRWSSCAPSYNAIAKKLDACVCLHIDIGAKRNVSSAHYEAWISHCTRGPCPAQDETCVSYGDCFNCGAPLDDKTEINYVLKCDCCEGAEEVVVCCACAGESDDDWDINDGCTPNTPRPWCRICNRN